MVFINQYHIKREVKPTFGQIKKHYSQMSQSEIKAIKSQLSKIDINNIKLSRHAMNEHINLDNKQIRKLFSAYDIIEFNITYRENKAHHRVLIRSKDTIEVICNNKLIKANICAVYDLTCKLVISIYLNEKSDNHSTLNPERYSNFTIDIVELLC